MLAAPARSGPARTDRAVVVPAALTDRPVPRTVAVAILGAGCAGLTLARRLVELGVTAPILLLDARTGYQDDRTWCFWDVEPTGLEHLAVARWERWRVRTAEGEAVAAAPRTPYRCIPAADFYADALAALAAAPNVVLALGRRVQAVEGALVRTAAGTVQAEVVVDARGLPADSAEAAVARRSPGFVPQQFVGLRVRTTRPVFDPDVCTLMDFAVDQSAGLRFGYVLPLRADEALVENVYLQDVAVPPAQHHAELAAYLASGFGLEPGEWTVVGTETGYLPMTDAHLPLRVGPDHYAVGVQGGAMRASTGYAFLRIQRSCRMLAEALAAGGPLPARVAPRRYAVLDAIFLRVLRQRPRDCPALYLRMFRDVPAPSLVRFLSEQATALDLLRLILAMPKRLFLGVALRSPPALLDAAR